MVGAAAGTKARLNATFRGPASIRVALFLPGLAGTFAHGGSTGFVIVGSDARGPQAQVAEFEAQGLAGDAQQEGGLVLIPPGVLQDAGQQQPVQLAVGLRVQVADVGPEPLADDERLRPGSSPRRRRRGGFAGPSRDSGRKAGSRTGPLARSSACFRTLCSSRMLPGQG